jgi:guanylate kinase
MNDGMLVVLSAPSGCGKTTLLKRVMADLPGLVFSVSHTTRSPRAREKNGQDYYFVDNAEFEALRDRQPSGFMEWAEVHGHFYGTGREGVLKQRAAGLDVLLDIDVQGAEQVRRASDPITIFVAPPSLDELSRRLQGRKTEDAATVARRLANAEQEMQSAPHYDYLIVNDVLVEAVESLRSILIAERLRRRRTLTGKPIRLLPA